MKGLVLANCVYQKAYQNKKRKLKKQILYISRVDQGEREKYYIIYGKRNLKYEGE